MLDIFNLKKLQILENEVEILRNTAIKKQEEIARRELCIKLLEEDVAELHDREQYLERIIAYQVIYQPLKFESGKGRFIRMSGKDLYAMSKKRLVIKKLFPTTAIEIYTEDKHGEDR